MSFFQSLGYVIEETPLGVPLLASGLVSLGLAVVAMVLALRRGRRVGQTIQAIRAEPDRAAAITCSTWAEMLAVVAALLSPVLAVVGSSISRAGMMLARDQADPSNMATMLAEGISGQMNAIAMGSMQVLLLAPLWAVALGLALALRGQARGVSRALELRKQGASPQLVEAWLQHPGPRVYQGLLPALALAMLAISPMAYGIMGWATGTITAFAGVAGVDPEHKAKILLLSMQETQQVLDRYTLIAGIGLGAATMLAFVLLGVTTAAKRRAQVAPELGELEGAAGPSGRATLITSAGCLVLAVLCAVLAWPYRQENVDPIPVRASGVLYVGTYPGLQTPEIRGPDELEGAPVISVTREGLLLLDGSEVGRLEEAAAAKRLAELLEVKRHNWQIVNPDRDFPGQVNLQADRRVRAKQIVDAVGPVLRERYSMVTLAFREQKVIKRPMLGELRWEGTSGARIQLVRRSEVPGDAIRLSPGARSPGISGDARWSREPPVLIELTSGATYGQLAAAVVAAREAGMRPLLALPN